MSNNYIEIQLASDGILDMNEHAMQTFQNDFLAPPIYSFNSAIIVDQMNDFNEPTTSNSLLTNKKRGIKKGTKRGHYDRSSATTRMRVLQAYENGDDWQMVADANGVKIKTASGWIKKGTVSQKKRGGVVETVLKIKPEHVDHLIKMLEENCQLSLKQLQDELMKSFGISVSHQTISNHLHGRLITVKKIHVQPDAANSLKNKRARKEFVESLMEVGFSFSRCFIDVKISFS